jgi:hypothetical protein
MKSIRLFLLLIIISGQILAQEITTFTLKIEDERINAPVSVPLNNLNYNTDKGNLVLYEITNAGEKEIPCQLEGGHTARLWFVLNEKSEKETNRQFVLKLEEKDSSFDEAVQLMKSENDLKLMVGENPVINYRHGIMYPPEEADPLYKRSGFIHPLWSPGGQVLTRIQPQDHYHHYGIWGPWTKTHIDEREADFWNLAKGQGTVKFAGFLSETEGEVFSGFKALQQHIDFGAVGPDQIAMNEILDVRVWKAYENAYIIDYTTTLNSPLEKGIMLDAYRYGGGIGFRATEKWHKDNCTVLTSDGKTRADADGSYARWCIVEGESDTEQGRSGILFLSHPSNRMHPEPMRVWPLDANGGRGDMYFEFVPIRHDDWKLNSNQDYTLKYRMVVFDGEMDAETAEMYWNSFATVPQVKIEQ